MKIKLKKNVNPLAYVGFLGFLGFLGYLGGQYSWLSLLGLLGLFSLLAIRRDERYKHNILRAGTNGFAAAMAGLLVLVVLIAVGSAPETVYKTVFFLFPAAWLIFTFSLLFFEWRGR